MPDLIFTGHAWREMARDSITEDDVYQVVGDYDTILEYDSGRTEYGRWVDDSRWIAVIIEDDGQTVVTAWEDKR